MLAIRLTPDIEKRLEKLAAKTGRTKTYYVREAILRHIEDMEDAAAAEALLRDIRAGKTKTLSLQEVMQQLGMGTAIRSGRTQGTAKARPARAAKNPKISARSRRAA